MDRRGDGDDTLDGGTNADLMYGGYGDDTYLVDNLTDVASEATGQGADQVKLMVSGGVASPHDPLDSIQFSMEEISAAVEEAHAFGRYVLTHAYTPEAITRAVKAGSTCQPDAMGSATAREGPELPSPSCPVPLSPQHETLPAVSIAHVCALPDASPANVTPSGIATATGGVLERGLDHDALEGRHRLVEQVRLAAAKGQIRPVAQCLLPVVDWLRLAVLVQQLGRQVADMHLAPGGHHRDPATGVFQLTHVAGPGQVLEVFLGFRLEQLGLDRQLLCGVGEKVPRQRRDILAPVGQARDVDADDIEPMEQVLAELPRLHLRLPKLTEFALNCHH